MSLLPHAVGYERPTTSAAGWLSGLKESLQNNAMILLPCLLFFALTVVMNWNLFVTPLIEPGDVAVNAIQVQNAKHLRELLGNYSRWHFHHPGPFFFYVFAAGEALFYDLLHIVPAPLNGEYLAEIALSSVCLFLAIYLFYVNVKAPLFPALAVLASIAFLYVLDTAIPSSAMISVWPPYMGIFCFLLFATACASVAAGNWKHTPLMALAGMMLVHNHVSQSLFVTVLAAAALASVIISEVRKKGSLRGLYVYKYPIAAALAIVLLFLLPIVIDCLIHNPSNVAQIRAYLRQHHGEHNSLKASILYVCSFFTYDVTPETALATSRPHLSELLRPDWFIRVYWSMFLAMFIGAVVSRIGSRHQRSSMFLKCVCAEIGLIVLLFLYWSWRITGPMFTFNGYFFFSVQLLALLVFSAVISRLAAPSLSKRGQTALASAAVAPLFLVAGVANGLPGTTDPDILPIIASLQTKHVKNILLSMLHTYATMMPGAGIASYWSRLGGHFYVEPDWGFVFGPEHTVGSNRNLYRVRLGVNRSICTAPCTVLYHHPGLYVTGSPYPSFLSLPALVAANDNSHESSGFYGVEGNSDWSEKNAYLKFYLSAANDDRNLTTLTITGTTLPGRPVNVSLNGSDLGTISTAGRTTQIFKVDPGRISWKGVNTVAFYVRNAAPVGADIRSLGYMFEDLVLRVERFQKATAPSKAVMTIPAPEGGSLIQGITWQSDGGWKIGAYHTDIGSLAAGEAWGSWNQNEASTGQLTSSVFSPEPSGCVVVPAGHGPSILGQRAAIISSTGETVAEIPLDAIDGNWQFYKVYYSRALDHIKIISQDEGQGFGQWMAIGQPRSCGPEVVHF